jgi:hypothetical protein
MIALIGSTGLIGQHLAKFIGADKQYNSVNICDMIGQEFDIVYCAAPSGNRIQAMENPVQDSASVDVLIDVLTQTKIGKIILISTGDTQVKPDTVYGHNRLRLEETVKQMNNYYIVRLSTLIADNITKNMLYDIKHETYLDKINTNTLLQWYPLDDLEKDLKRIMFYGIRETNLCSEPFYGRDIIKYLAPHLADKIVNYPEGQHYRLTPYSYLRDDILNRMREYLK